LVLRGELPVEERGETRVSAVRKRQWRWWIRNSSLRDRERALSELPAPHDPCVPTAPFCPRQLANRKLEAASSLDPITVLLEQRRNQHRFRKIAHASRAHAPTTIYNHASPSEPWRRRHVQLRQVYAFEQDGAVLQEACRKLTWEQGRWVP
jgi:hypothetical protein